MSLQGALCALLMTGPAHGYDLLGRLEAELGDLWEIRTSNVYLTLGRMEQAALVTSEREKWGGRSRQLLTLTSRGQEFARRWIYEGDDRAKIGLRLAVARLLGADTLRDAAAAIQANLTATLHDLYAIRRSASASGFQCSLAELEAGRVRAELRWVSQIAAAANTLAASPSLPAQVGHVNLDVG